MALMTKKEFAHACGMETNALAVYLHPSRAQVVINEAGYIDTENPTNGFFLTKRTAKGKTKGNIPNFNSSPVYLPKDDKTTTDTELPSYEQSEQLVKFWDAKKREKEVEKLQLEIEKKRGVVVPSELIEPILLQHNQSLISAFENACDRILTMYAKIKDFNPMEIAEMRGEITLSINEGIDKATIMSLKEVENIVNEFSERIGSGNKA